MKTNLISILVVLALVGNAATATQKPVKNAAVATAETNKLSISVKQLDDLKFRVTVENQNSPKASLKIQDENQRELVFEGVILEKSYVKVFDLSPVADGKYTFIVENRNEKVSQTIEIKTQTNKVVSLLAQN